jgi:hypothetical protein
MHKNMAMSVISCTPYIYINDIVKAANTRDSELVIRSENREVSLAYLAKNHPTEMVVYTWLPARS